MEKYPHLFCIHCRAYLLPLELTSARNTYILIKRTLQVIKDNIYKMFRGIQEAINKKKMKIPETIDTSWLSNN